MFKIGVGEDITVFYRLEEIKDLREKLDTTFMT